MEPSLSNLRNYMTDLSIKFQKATETNIKKYIHNQSNYEIVSQTIKAIIDSTINYSSKISDRVTFLVGATGAGKSTLLNYLATGDDNFKVANHDGAIKTYKQNVAQIGGVSATTLYPNLYQNQLGIFLDCAGQGDTGGIVIQIINSIIKAKIAKNVSQIKVLFVAPYGSFKAVGAYGHSFKMALDKNAQFIGDMNKIKDNIAFIITGALRKKSAVSSAVQGLNYILGHADVGNYLQTMKAIIKNDYIAVFSKPQQDAQIGDIYTPPQWNLNQRQKIIDLINKVPFGKIETSNFFNISTSPSVRQIMSKALHIVVMKAGNYVEKLFKQCLPLQIYSVELQGFSKFVNQLSIGFDSSLKTFVQILKFNNYFKIQFDNQIINKLQKQMDFLDKFCKSSKYETQNPEKDQLFKKNWTIVCNLQHKLNQIYGDLQKIIRTEGNNFTKFMQTKTIKTISSSQKNAQQIKQYFEQYVQKEKQLQQIILLGKMQQSKFYKDLKKQQFTGTTQQEYVDKQKYIDYQSYKQWQPAQYQRYIDEQQKQVKETVLKKQEYEQTTFKPVTKMKKVEIQQQKQQYNGKKTLVTGLLTLGTVPLLKKIFTGDAGMYDKVQKKQQIEIATTQIEEVIVKKQRIVPQTQTKIVKQKVQRVKTVQQAGQVQKTRQTIKQKDVTKYRQKANFKDLTIRQLNEMKYKQQIYKCKGCIQNLRKSIQNKIDNYPKGSNLKIELPLITTKNSYQDKCKDLLIKWQKAEYVAYFVKNANNCLDKINLSDLIKQMSQKQNDQNRAKQISIGKISSYQLQKKKVKNILDNNMINDGVQQKEYLKVIKNK